MVVSARLLEVEVDGFVNMARDAVKSVRIVKTTIEVVLFAMNEIIKQKSSSSTRITSTSLPI